MKPEIRLSGEVQDEFREAMRRWVEIMLEEMENCKMRCDADLEVEVLQGMSPGVQTSCWSMGMHLGLEVLAKKGCPDQIIRESIQELVEHWKAIQEVRVNV